MEYVVVAFDGTDSEALSRRMAVRSSHIKLGDEMRDEGKLLFAFGITNDEGNLCGSVMILNFDSDIELNKWKAEEPYIVGDVWKDIKIHTGKVGPSFSKK
jgi:uncharacterized protein YciI